MHTPTIGDSSPRSVAVRGTLASDTNVVLAVVVATVVYGKFAGDMYMTCCGAAPPPLAGPNCDPGSVKPVNCIFNEPVCVASSATWCPVADDGTTPNAVVAAGCVPGTVWCRLVRSIIMMGALEGCNCRTAVIAWLAP